MAREGNIAVNRWIGTKERFADLCNGVMCGGKQMICPEDLEPLDREADIIVVNMEGIKQFRTDLQLVFGMLKYRNNNTGWDFVRIPPFLPLLFLITIL